MSFFSAASMTISIFTAVQVFAWIATIWKGRPVLTTAMHYRAGIHRPDRHRRAGRHCHGRRAARLAIDTTLTGSCRTFIMCWSAPTCFRSSPRFYYWLPKDDRAHDE